MTPSHGKDLQALGEQRVEAPSGRSLLPHQLGAWSIESAKRIWTEMALGSLAPCGADRPLSLCLSGPESEVCVATCRGGLLVKTTVSRLPACSRPTVLSCSLSHCPVQTGVTAGSQVIFKGKKFQLTLAKGEDSEEFLQGQRSRKLGLGPEQVSSHGNSAPLCWRRGFGQLCVPQSPLWGVRR